MTDVSPETMLESRDREPLSHSLEDYLEAAVDLAGDERKKIRAVDLANKLDVSKASVFKAISNLKEKGYVIQPYYGDIELTDAGYKYGMSVWRKHQVLYLFFTQVLGIDGETANYEACQMEHSISSESFAKWEEFLETQGIHI